MEWIFVGKDEDQQFTFHFCLYQVFFPVRPSVPVCHPAELKLPATFSLDSHDCEQWRWCFYCTFEALLSCTQHFIFHLLYTIFLGPSKTVFEAHHSKLELQLCVQRIDSLVALISVCFIRILTSHRPFSFLCQSELGRGFTSRPPCSLARRATGEPLLTSQRMSNWPAAGGR